MFDFVISQGVTLADKWILSRFGEVVESATKKLETYEFSQAGEELRDFTWSEFADWYLEIAKIQKENGQAQSTDQILLYILERLLVMWHPFMPFVTEEIYKLFETDQMLIVQDWPCSEIKKDKKATEQFDQLKEIITTLRTIRSEYKIAPKILMQAQIVGDLADDLSDSQEIIKKMARLEMLELSDKADKPPGAVSAVVGSLKLYVPLSGLVDLTREKERLSKDLKETQNYLDGMDKKLSNQAFVKKAPKEIVAELKQKQEEADQKLQTIKQQLADL
ncbi:class I tRNA ligase family protein [Patescibacteria group bacterium]